MQDANEAILKITELKCLYKEPSAPHTATVIFMHGLSQKASLSFHILAPVLELPQLSHVRFVFPSAPVRQVTLRDHRFIPAWFNLFRAAVVATEDTKGILHMTALIHQIIEGEIARGIPSTSICLAGMSQGGAITLHSALTYPKPLAGVLAVNTYLPLATSFLKLGKLQQPKSTPIKMTHAKEDITVRYKFGKYSYQYMKYILLRNISFTTYPGLDHYQVNEDFEKDVMKFFVSVVGDKEPFDAGQLFFKRHMKMVPEYDIQDQKMLLLGLPSSGKTTLLHFLKYGSLESAYIPTKNVNVEEIELNSQLITIWDLFGDLYTWRRYFENVVCILFVIDSTKSFEEAKNSLTELASAISNQSIIIILNKFDMLSLEQQQALEQSIQLVIETLSIKTCKVCSCNVQTGLGIDVLKSTIYDTSKNRN